MTHDEIEQRCISLAASMKAGDIFDFVIDRVSAERKRCRLLCTFYANLTAKTATHGDDIAQVLRYVADEIKSPDQSER